MENSVGLIDFDFDSLLENNININNFDYDPVQLDTKSPLHDGHMYVQNEAHLQNYSSLRENIDFLEKKILSDDNSFSALLESSTLSCENESELMNVSNSNLQCVEGNLLSEGGCFLDQFLNLEYQGSTSSVNLDNLSPSSRVDNSSLDYDSSSSLSTYCATDSLPSSFESCVLDSCVNKSEVVRSSFNSSPSSSDNSSSTETSSPNMVAPVHFVGARQLIEIPKLNKDVGFHGAPACGRGKTHHSFGPCSPSTCKTRKLAGPQELSPSNESQMEVSIVKSCIKNEENFNIYSNNFSDIGNNKNLSEKVPIQPSEVKSLKPTNFIKPKRIITVKKSEAYQAKSTKKQIEELPFWSLKRGRSSSGKTASKKSKCKAYQLEPLPDPKLERCRRNAINAKKNREAKKELLNTLQHDLENSREENKVMRSKMLCLESKVEELMAAFKRLEEEKEHATALAAKLQAENYSLHQKLKAHIQ